MRRGEGYGGAFDDMAIFGRRYQSPEDPGEHIRYMEEQLEFFARQMEKRLGELEKRVAALEKAGASPRPTE